MEYHEAVERLERLQRLRPKLGTETTTAILSTLDEPHRELTCVQITGSNGKGSTARILASILDAAGLTTGLYTSPDLNDLRDRITVSGHPISKSAVTAFVETAWPTLTTMAADGDGPTFFEALTAMAFWHFERADVDVAILEVGIGGRYDATSVIDPVASAVTSVSLEHTDIIGSTIEEIARDKASVAPADRPLVTGATGRARDVLAAETDLITVGPKPSHDPPETGDRDDTERPRSETSGMVRGGVETVGNAADGVESERVERGDREAGGAELATRSNATNSPEVADVTVSEAPTDVPTLSSLSITGEGWTVDTETPLLGEHQAVNAGIAAQLARQVANASERDIAAGIRTVHWPGRFEVMDDSPLVVLDGAHNPAACGKLAPILDRFDYDTVTLVFGAMRDKDHEEMARQLPQPERVFLAAPAVPRAEDVDVLATVFGRETDANVHRCASVAGALEDAIRATPDSGCVLVTGSLYMVAEARARWTITPRVIRTDSDAAARRVLRNADVPATVRQDRSGEMVPRTLQLSARRATAQNLVSWMHQLGGTGAVSGLSSSSRQVDVVLSGSMDQFRGLVRQLRGAGDDGRHLAATLNDALGIGHREQTGEYPWSDGTAVMGILNVTPDSFHDGGEYDTVDAAVTQATEMVEAGADIVDVGGESTRPGADPVPAEVERDRVVPVIEALQDIDVMVSVDTRKPAVAEAALAAGADMVNDVTGLADAAMRRVVAKSDVPVVAMHSLTAPVDPGMHHEYDDVVDDVVSTLTERLLQAERDGIDRSNILLDPGLGFGKRSRESLELLDRLDEFTALGQPLLVGHSHKSMFASVARDADDRFAATIAATALAAERGADVVRVHDVAANVDAVRTASAVTDQK